MRRKGEVKIANGKLALGRIEVNRLHLRTWLPFLWGFLGGASGKESTYQCRRHRDVGWISGSGRSPGLGNGTLFPYSCLGNPMHRGVWRATVHRVAKESNTTEWLNTYLSFFGGVFPLPFYRCCIPNCQKLFSALHPPCMKIHFQLSPKKSDKPIHNNTQMLLKA